MKYFVIATHWDNEKKAQAKYIAGLFDNYVNASLFKQAYNDRYHADAKVVKNYELINGEMEEEQ